MTKKFPHTYVIIFTVLVFSAILTWVVPGGKYVKQKVIDSQGNVKYIPVYDTVYINNNILIKPKFTFIENKKQTWQIFSAFFDGFVKQSQIVIFILIIGGAFWILNSTRAIDIGIVSFIGKTQKLKNIKFINKIGVEYIILVVIMLIFSLFGAIFGMSEETIAFVVILIPLAISLGFDSIVGMSIVYLAASLGFAGALLNPFTIGIAQGIAAIPLFSGLEYRFICWLVINLIGFMFIIFYAKKVKKNISNSIVYETDSYWRQLHTTEQSSDLKEYKCGGSFVAYFLVLIVLGFFSILYPSTTIKFGNWAFKAPFIPIFSFFFALSGFYFARKSAQKFNLVILTFTIIFLIIGVMGYEWYVKEIAALFLFMGLISGIAANYDANKIAKLFIEGAKDILSAALVVGLAGGIIVILENGNIIDTILFYLTKSMEGFGKIVSANFMYLTTTLLNILIPSGSAKAAIIMPIMAPFSDYLHISRQIAVLAFQFGDGFTNLITPTSGVLIGVLEVAKIPFDKWLKWVWPLVLILVLLGSLMIIPPLFVRFNGF